MIILVKKTRLWREYKKENAIKYGYADEATELVEKIIKLFGQDIERCGELLEYYDPDTGEGVKDPGFQNWNLLSINMVK